jgi:hypothetical protein
MELYVFMRIQKYFKPTILFITLVLVLGTSFNLFSASFSGNGSQLKIENLKSSAINYSNATIISDGYNGSYWNSANSEDPRIAVDSNNIVHVVWQDGTDGVWGTDYEIMYVNYIPSDGWSNITVISDGYSGSYWNDGYSSDPAIAIDSHDRIHVVFEDDTDGVWGTDYELMYVHYTPSIGWSNITVISDGYSGIYWNDGYSYEPSIVIDSDDNIHVVWYDYTDGIWGSDTEIMYVKYTEGAGWSNATVISDGYNGSYWNEGGSDYPKMEIDNDILHVVWVDQTDGIWGTDYEIMYVKYTEGAGWSNATVISDGYGGSYWNDDYSQDPSITCLNGEIHVVWEDGTDGEWGIDYEIMHVKYTLSSGWSNVSVISDGYAGSYWNNAQSYNAELIADYNGVLHLIWEDYTDGIWGTDTEIMYVNYTTTNGWTNITVISDGYAGSYWNDGLSRYPDICYGLNNVYIVWQDGTDGVWGTDYEIMFTKFTIPPPAGPSRRAIPSGLYFLIGMFICTIGLVYYVKRKF